jgi:hypothetical protein
MIHPQNCLLTQAHGRRMVTEIITNEIIGACCGGPRGNDQYVFLPSHW